MDKRLMTAIAVAGLALGSAGALRGAEILPTESSDDGTAPEIELTTCGVGKLKECGSYTSKSCTQWSMTNASGSGSFSQLGGGSLSGSVSGTCVSFTEITIKLYKDQYKTKTA